MKTTNKMLKYFYFLIGGMLLLTSSLAFAYFTLFGYNATISQWSSAAILMAAGGVFLTIASELE